MWTVKNGTPALPSMPQADAVRCFIKGFDFYAGSWHQTSTAFLLKAVHAGARGAGGQPEEYVALWKKYLRWELERQLETLEGDLSWLPPWSSCLPSTPDEMPVIAWIASGAFPRRPEAAAVPPPPPPDRWRVSYDYAGHWWPPAYGWYYQPFQPWQ